MAGNQSTPEPTLSSPDAGRDIIIEVATENNGYVIFGPLNEKLRGRWDNRFTAGKSGEAIGHLAACAYYPGIYLSVNLTTGVTRKYDPIGLPKFKTELDTLNRVANAYPQMFGGSKVAPHPESAQYPENDVDAEATASRLKDWLYWMRYLVNNRQAIVVEGSADLPSERFIREMPGARRRHHSVERYEETDDRGRTKPIWTDAVPLKGGKREPSGAAA